MRLPVVVACLLSLFPVAARGQNAPSGPLTLDQVLELAQARSESIAIAREGLRRAEGEAVRARSALFPQLTGSFQYERALASEFQGLFDTADTGGDQGGDPSFEDLPFGRENTFRASLALSQSLYSGGRIAAQRALATATGVSADVALTTARAQLLFDVTQSYYNAVLGDRLVAIAEATLGQAAATLQQAEAAFKAGTQPEFEVLRARVSRDTQHPTVIRQKVNREIALLRLKQLLELPPDYDLRLADTLGEEMLVPAPVFAARVAPIERAIVAAGMPPPAPDAAGSVVERAAVRSVAATVSLREAALDLVRAQRMPSVSLISNYGRNAYPANFLPKFDRVNWTVGVNVQVPILTGGRQRGDEIVAQADLDQTRVQLRQLEELAALDTQQALAELTAALATWEATAGTIEQATRAFELAEIRYQAGVSTQLELSDSRLLLQQAEANRAVAARDLQIARARVALLPGLPIGAGGTSVPAGGEQQFTRPPAPSPPPTGGTTGLQSASTQPGAMTFGGGQ